MNTKCKENKLFKEFCKYAKYIPQLGDKCYTIEANGKRLYSNDTEDLFNQYEKELTK